MAVCSQLRQYASWISKPRTNLGAAMARSVGSKPSDNSDAGMAHTPLSSSRDAHANPASDGRKRHTIAKLGTEKPSKRTTSMALPRELFSPTKRLANAELALAARQIRLRREAADSESDSRPHTTLVGLRIQGHQDQCGSERPAPYGCRRE